MAAFFQRYSTPFITGFFLISLISGIGLFFHFGPSGFRGMHEWLSMVLILPFALHVWKNWRPLLAYFKRSAMPIALGISLVAAGAFLIPTGSGDTADGPPQIQLMHKIMGRPLADVATALGTTPEALSATLTAAGFSVPDSNATLADIAKASGKTEMDMTLVLIKPLAG
jgi:hypothetical protein